MQLGGKGAKRYAAQAEWIETTLIYLNVAQESFASPLLALGGGRVGGRSFGKFVGNRF